MMTQAKIAVSHQGVRHYPGICNRCKIKFFDLRWGRDKFIKGNRGTKEELALSYDQFHAQREIELENIGGRSYECGRCRNRIEILEKMNDSE